MYTKEYLRRKGLKALKRAKEIEADKIANGYKFVTVKTKPFTQRLIKFQ